ncbi:TPA: hypothetical protein L4Q76_001710 [Pseudomonas aeruginosa]|uniref:hypothetical protein n=1 Tax=Pseudomonas aeruginosa TaxID=287 RepID=UPI0004F31701|nr:hypothetical protein [Pseudomonas aeruginosa]EKT9494453.1 hypothetical protein [Pseudomonas aeruginosa]MBH4028498.1 hypothetical protein [Pseudomonas aeruginosa]MBV5530532.1 hypothetical protein [Pseudomonas aeruginosa]MCS8095423.1 hypothetical protein [Pseudomonas aeruginosa]HBO2879692.1 hypothetical protein [Pseudomonas aeruginosa]
MTAEHFTFLRPKLPRDYKCAGDLRHEVPEIGLDSTNTFVMEIFTSNREIICLAVVEDGLTTTPVISLELVEA